MPRSKNNPAYRQKREEHFCSQCGKERKPVLRVSPEGKRKIVRQCDCGLFNKSGEKIE